MKAEQLKEKFEGTHINFQENIFALSKKYNKPYLTIYEWWREYSDQCRFFDQSALLSEFVDWYQEKLTS